MTPAARTAARGTSAAPGDGVSAGWLALPLDHCRLRTRRGLRLAPIVEPDGAAPRDVSTAGSSHAASLPPGARAGGVVAWTVDADTAELLVDLDRPTTVPPYVRDRSPRRWRADLARLILDGLVEVDAGGTFVSGPAALAALCSPQVERVSTAPSGCLSSRALAHAAATAPSDAESLAARLYNYNRMPVSPGWARRVPNLDATMGLLGLHAGGSVARRIARHWGLSSAPGPEAYWLTWSPLAPPSEAQRTAWSPKLYVSPHPGQLPDVLCATIDVMADVGPAPFKIALGAAGMLRPDKLVIYPRSSAALHELASELVRALAGVRPHGVPFTAPLDRDGLVSWGADPPSRAGIDNRSTSDSWRGWVTHRLALYLLAARSAGVSPIESMRFATARLSADGVDTTCWAPDLEIWEP